MQEKIIDLEDALDRVQDDKELLLELFDIFEKDFKVKRKELEKSLSDGDVETVRNISHSLKGASGNISAVRIQALCFFIEKTSSENILDGIEERLPELDVCFEEYKKEAQSIRDDMRLL